MATFVDHFHEDDDGGGNDDVEVLRRIGFAKRVAVAVMNDERQRLFARGFRNEVGDLVTELD